VKVAKNILAVELSVGACTHKIIFAIRSVLQLASRVL